MRRHADQISNDVGRPLWLHERFKTMYRAPHQQCPTLPLGAVLCGPEDEGV